MHIQHLFSPMKTGIATEQVGPLFLLSSKMRTLLTLKDDAINNYATTGINLDCAG